MDIDPSDRPSFSDYRDSFVAFLDLLGFSEAVESIATQEDFDRISWLLFAIKKEAESYSGAEGILADLSATAVSDSIIVSVPFNGPAAAMKFVAMLHYLQYNLLVGFQAPLRGFVTRGPLYHHDGILFGAGFMAAYRGESTAKFPRVVVDPQIIEHARSVIEAVESLEAKVSIFDYLDEDSDGCFFIDYLKPVGAVANNPEIDSAAEHRRIRNFTALCLRQFADNRRILPKYEWLQAYCDRRLL